MLASASSQTNSTDRFSQDLGEKLLQGWAMLDASCPNCPSIPLMRPRNSEELYCVSCKSYLSTMNAQLGAEYDIETKSNTTIHESPSVHLEIANTMTRVLPMLQLSIAMSLEKDAQLIGSNSASSLDTTVLSNVEQKLKLIQMINSLNPKIQ